MSEPRTSSGRGGRLTERLLAEGLLTPAVLGVLQKEWSKQNKRELLSGDKQSKKVKSKKLQKEWNKQNKKELSSGDQQSKRTEKKLPRHKEKF